MKTYSNPRTHVAIENWPIGSGKRGVALFYIEQKNGKERAIRTTFGKPKKLTYALKARIVDGSDGRTYIAEWNGNFFCIMRGDMKLQEEAIFSTVQVEQDGKFVSVENPRFAELQKLFVDSSPVSQAIKQRQNDLAHEENIASING